jgi:hypothetical protein
VDGEEAVVAAAPDGHAWFATEAEGIVSMGDVLEPGMYTGFQILGKRAVFSLFGGGEVAAALLSHAAAVKRASVWQATEKFLADYEKGVLWKAPDLGVVTPRGEISTDARVLEIVKKCGIRDRDWDDLAAHCLPLDMEEWPVEGPRSAAWVIRFLAKASKAGPSAYHKWSQMIAKLSAADWGVSEHGQICRYLQLGGCFDQADLTNLAMVEAMCRRLQLIEYQYRDRMRDARSGGMQGGAAASGLTGLAVMQGEEADLFDGIPKDGGVVCVAPQLVKWISAELERTAQIDKAARKAREENNLLRGTADLRQPPQPQPPDGDQPPNRRGRRGRGGGGG